MRALMWGTIAAVAVAAACATEKVTGPGPGRGMLVARLTDAPTPLDSIKAVNLFVVRVDARRAEVRDSADVDMDLDREHSFDDDNHEAEHADSTQWVTIAAPNRAFNLLELQGGVTAFLGATAADTGHFKAIRLVIDPTRSSIVLADGTVLSMTSNPPVEFENRGRHGLLVEFDDDVNVREGDTTTITLDIRLESSVALRGRTIRDGFIFRPVVVGRSEHEH